MGTGILSGIARGRVDRWLAEHVPGAVPPFDYRAFAGGRSNLTYAVTDREARRFVLRRPPLGHVLASAHDMRREHRTISALAPTVVAVAHQRLACRVPPQRRTSVVHGDYRLENCILNPDGTVRAVIDWELCTLGDPLADLGWFAAYWVESGETGAHPPGGVAAMPAGFL